MFLHVKVREINEQSACLHLPMEAPQCGHWMKSTKAETDSIYTNIPPSLTFDENKNLKEEEVWTTF